MDVDIEEAPLDEVFMRFYGDEIGGEWRDEPPDDTGDVPASNGGESHA